MPEELACFLPEKFYLTPALHSHFCENLSPRFLPIRRAAKAEEISDASNIHQLDESGFVQSLALK